MADIDLQAQQIRDAEAVLLNMANKLPFDMSYAVRLESGEVWATTVTRAWGCRPVIFNKPLADCMRDSIKLWMVIAQSALALIESACGADPQAS